MAVYLGENEVLLSNGIQGFFINWSINQVVYIGTLCIYSNIKYICTRAHTTTTGLEPSTATGYWSTITV